MPFIPDNNSVTSGGGFVPDNPQRKPFFESIGSEMTPEQKVEHPILSGIQQTAKDVTTLGYKAADGLTLGNLSNVVKHQGIEPPNFEGTAPENKSGLKLAGDVANLTGFIKNPLANAAGEAAVAGKVGKAALTGGATGALIAPENDTVGNRAIQAAGGAVLGAGTATIPNAINAFPKVKEFVTGMISGPEKAQAAAQEAKFKLSQDTAEKLSETQRIGKAKIGIAQENASVVSKGYDDLSDTLKKQVAKYSDKEGLDLQDNLPKVFAKKSKEYGFEQDDIIKSLSDEERVIPSETVVKGMEDSLEKFGLLRREPSGQLIVARAPLTPAEQQVFGLYEHTKKFSQVNIEDLMKTQKYIEPQYGQAWAPDDKLRAEIARGFANNVSEAVPALQELKTKYAPFLEWKNAAIDTLKPFNSQYDVATKSIGKIGAGEINPSEQRLMAKLQKVYQSPYGARINALNKGVKTTAMNKEQAAKAAKEGIQRLRNSLANDLKEIRQNRIMTNREIEKATDKLIQKYKNQRILTGIGLGGISLAGGGKLMEYFVRREAYSNLHGRY